MGKRKIGEIYNRPIIEGDINLKTSSEIHKSELSVPQSGGGGRNAMEYFSDEVLSAALLYLSVEAHEIKMEVTYADGTKGMVVGPAYVVSTFVQTQKNNGEITKKKDVAYGIDMTRKIRTTDAIMTIKESILSYSNITETELDSIPRITEEEFYNTEA